jgi:Fe-S-cluster containining protein
VSEAFPPVDCTVCGRCCFSHAADYVRVWGSDWDRMDDRARSFTVFGENRCYMRIEDGRCAALEVDAERGTFFCAIYAMRPETCRSFERGSGTCRADYFEKGDRVDVTIERMRTRRPG